MTDTMLHGACAEALTLPGNQTLCVDHRVPLPGVIIFVHGVNSNGEWFTDAEAGLCKGLNDRLQRNADQVFRAKGVQLQPATYLDELTKDGFIRDDLKAESFIQAPGNSPVIHFRWGYKAHKDEVAAVGGTVLLDEADAWGGGPFANGCSALPDMFSNGVDAGLFLGLGVQHMTASDRLIYSCPARHYQAFAAWRLAKLVARVREMHRGIYTGMDCPVTVVCHSQGNMIGLGSAFFGNHDSLGGLGVADTYVLANAPYSLRKNIADNFSQYKWTALQGRVTHEARVKTLSNFFDIVRNFQPKHYSDDSVNQGSRNSAPQNGDKPRTAEDDRKDHDTRGRVFLYCNPHDRVISVATVQGFGWLGMSQEDVNETKATGVLYQRVWAQTKPDNPLKVGSGTDNYDYWERTIGANWGTSQFWEPRADRLRIQLKEIWGDERKSLSGKVLATGAGFVFQLLLWAGDGKGLADANAHPAARWAVPVNAPKVPGGGIEPRALYLPRGNGQAQPGEVMSSDGVRVSGPINRHHESSSDGLNRSRTGMDGNDPYAQQRSSGRGEATSEAAMRYDQNAGVRHEVRRVLYSDDGKPKSGSSFSEDDIRKMDAEHHIELANTEFGKFEQETRMGLLAKGVDMQTTNHSTILANPAHSEHVLAYDVDVGMCFFDEKQLNQLRRMADWRWCKPLDGDWMPDGKQPEDDKEFGYYQTAVFENTVLAKNERFDPEQDALKRLKIDGTRNASPLQASNGTGIIGPRVA
ncbi:DUF3274 domain-containing protein [Pandoraea sp. NPDC090278]|uniref:T6SS effector phospholipase Tle3 domain-containing protein n=1 Tax=Pandoraea sp. NPDC090278 TaxID=3364391 RepID=UPI003839F97E